MIGGWIKMRGNLRTNVKVLAMAKYLASDAAFMAWFRDGSVTSRVTERDIRIVTGVTIEGLLFLWSTARECITEDDIVPFATIKTLSTIADIPSFGEAMGYIGWAVELPDGAGVRLPNFSEYNSVVAYSRGQSGAERTKRWRDKKRDVTQSSQVTSRVTVCDAPREEQNREEKNRVLKTPPNPPEGERRKRESKLSQFQKERFDRWYKAYPKKVSPAHAEKAWDKIKPDDDLLDRMIAAVERQKQTEQWRRGVIPNPATWLNGRRWEDDAGALDLGKPGAAGTTRKDDYEARQEEGMRKLRELMAANAAAEEGPGVPVSGRSVPQAAGGLF
jgi:hypothetical protein